MVEVGMNKIVESFLSNQWNIYGLQILCGSLMVMVLHNYLTIFQICIMALCVYLIAMCQRILGVRYGMVYAKLEQDRIDYIVSEVKKIQKERKKKKGK